MTEYGDKPCADPNVPGLISYRYRGRFGWIMIGAFGNEDAMKEARRSTYDPVNVSKLEVWDGAKYVPVNREK